MVKPDGSRATTAGSTTANPQPTYAGVAYKNDLTLACTAPPHTYKIRVCVAQKRDSAYETTWTKVNNAEYTYTVTLKAMPSVAEEEEGSEPQEIAKAIFTRTSGTIIDIGNGISAKCTTISHQTSDLFSEGVYGYDLMDINPNSDYFADTEYHDDYEKSYSGTTGMYGDEDFSDGTVDFGFPQSEADLTKTLLIVQEVSNNPFCYKRKYVNMPGFVPFDMPYSRTAPVENRTYSVSVPALEGYQAIGALYKIGDYGQNLDFIPYVSFSDGSGPYKYNQDPQSRITISSRCTQFNGSCGGIDLCTTSSNTVRQKTATYMTNSSLAMTKVDMVFCGSSSENKVRVAGVQYVYRKVAGCAAPTFEMRSTIRERGSATSTGSGDSLVCSNLTGTAFPYGDIQATDQNNVTYAGTTSTGVSSYQYSVQNLPIDQTFCLKYTPPDGYRCSCPTGCEYCGRKVPVANVNVNESQGTVTSVDPVTNLRFYVTKAALSWYQTIGGEVAALAKTGTAIRDWISSNCTGSCQPYLILPYVAGQNNTAGSLTVQSTANVDLKDTVGFQESNVAPGTPAPRLSRITTDQTCKENYEYFYRLYSVGTNPTDDFPDVGGIGKPGSSIGMRQNPGETLSDVPQSTPHGLIAQDVIGGGRGGTPTPDPDVITPDPTPTPSPAPFGVVSGPDPVTPTQVPVGGKPYYFNRGDLTVNYPWAVTASEKIVVFVDGNLSIQQPITVEKNGFLAFIVSGNITIASHIGTTTLTSTGPGQVQGVYVANGSIEVESVGDSGASEIKFIGEGVFAACSGISLPRNYELGGSASNNNLYPTSLFVARPDFMFSLPDKMKVPQTNWREVNP